MNARHPAPTPGELWAFWDGDGLALGVVVAEVKRRLRMIVGGGRERRIPTGRLGWLVTAGGPSAVETRDARAEAVRRLEDLERRTGRRVAEVEIGSLWQLALETGGSRVTLDAATLAELALGSSDGPARVALVRALLADAVHFKRRGEAWEPRTERQVADLLRERRSVVERERETARFFRALCELVRGGSFQSSGGAWESRYLDALQQLAVLEEAAPAAARGMALEALQASGLAHDRPHEGAFRLLRLVGRFDSDDENLQLLRFGLRSAFPAEVLEAAAAAVARGFSAGGRVDLLDLRPVSIDSPHTHEIDDALSITPHGTERVTIGIHIADPGAFAVPGDPVDREALARGLSHYHPDVRLTMLPPVISEDAASLVAGEARPAVSFLIEIGGDGEPVGWRIVLSVVRSAARLSYVEADRSLAAGEGRFRELLEGLARFAALRQRRRREAGAVILDAPDVDLRVDGAGRVRLERLDGGSAARGIVTEAMVLAGELAAQWCEEAGVPAIYRRQAPPTALPELPSGPVADPVAVRRVRRTLNRGETGLRPGRHFGLGVARYAQVTSPLRRFQDLATLRQIVARLTGVAPPYDTEALQRIAATTERAEADARKAERAAKDFWSLRFLEQAGGAPLEAIVVETEPRPVVQLSATLREQPMPSLTGVTPGDRLRVRVERVNPRAGLLVLRRVDA